MIDQDTVKLIVRQEPDCWEKLRLAIVAQALRDTERIIRNGRRYGSGYGRSELIRFWESGWAMTLTGLNRKTVDGILNMLGG